MAADQRCVALIASVWMIVWGLYTIHKQESYGKGGVKRRGRRAVFDGVMLVVVGLVLFVMFLAGC